jgi:hypothetical protein
LGVDGEKCGSEMRFINDYRNISDECNVIMRTVYIGTYPKLVIVCTKDIEVGDEFLLDYGSWYVDTYFTAPQSYPEQVEGPMISWKELAGDGSSSEEEETVEEE